MPAIRTKAKYVKLGGLDLLPRGPVQFEMTNIHGRKVSLGDPGPDSHPTNSTTTQHTWNGGGQIKRANPASDMMRFWWSTLMTEYDHYLTLPPETHVYGDPTAFSMCLGDYPFTDGGTMHFQIGDTIWTYSDTTDTIVAGVSMGGHQATGEGVVYKLHDGPITGPAAKLFIPTIDGYVYYDTTVHYVSMAGDAAVDFAVWDDKLFLLTASGSLWWSIRPAGAFPADWTNVITISGTDYPIAIPDGSSPRHLVNYVNRSDAEVLYVVTSSAVFGLDFENGRLVKTYFSYPRHPRQGYGATAWRAELWTSVGIGAHRYDLSQVIPSGIDRDQGVPLEYRGYVTDIAGSYNDLFMYIRGVQVGETAIAPEDATLDVGGGDETMYASGATFATQNLLVNWNGIGYHYRWADVGNAPGNLYVSQAQNNYNLWWCNNGQVLRQRIPTTYFNPVDPPTEGFTWAESGYLITPWYDWNWPDQLKVLKRLEFGVEVASLTETIVVSYQVDKETPVWIPCLTIDAPGRWSCTLGEDPADLTTLPGGATRFYGVRHNRFRLKFEMVRATDPWANAWARYSLPPDDPRHIADPTDTLAKVVNYKEQRPVLDWWSAVGRRVLNPIRTWRFNVDNTKQAMGTYPAATIAKLVEYANSVKAIEFDIGDEGYMVEVIALAGPRDPTGQEFSGFTTIHLLEANDMEISLP